MDKQCPKCGYIMILVEGETTYHWMCMSPMCGHFEEMEREDADD